MPKDVEEIRRIILLAKREKIPVTPFVYGTNVGGLSIPAEGSILVDLRRMNRIVSIDDDGMVAVVEPRVTQSQLKKELDKRGLYYPYTAGPHCGSVMCSALLEGVGNLSLITGNQADNITGLEVVLPTGELVKVGSCTISPYWFAAFPLPDLRGLFVGWQGTTGIVTKIGLKLIPKRPAVDLVTLKHFNYNDIGPLLSDLA
jgi:glycolate oxidase